MEDSFGDEFDDEGDEKEEDKDPAFLEKDCILFAIDARRRMAQPRGPNESSPLVQALGAVAASMRARVVAGDMDLIGVLLFGTEQTSPPGGMENTFELLPFDVPSASSIEKLQTLHASKNFSEFGHVDDAGQDGWGRAFWQISLMYTGCKAANNCKWRVFILTDDDFRHCPENDVQITVKRAKDLGEANIILEPFFFPAPSSIEGGPAPKFDLGEGSFWRRILSAAREGLQRPIFKRDSEAAALTAGEETTLSVTDSLIPAACVCADIAHLEARLERAQHRRRPYASLALRLGPTGAPTLSVRMVTIIAPFKRPTTVKLHARTNEVLCTEKSAVDEVHGAPLTREDMFKTFDLGGKTLYFEPFELTSAKITTDLLGRDEPPLVLLGFRPIEALKPYLNMRNSTFLEPSNQAAGTLDAMQALVDAMVIKRRFALARFSRLGTPSLVALLPQQLESDPITGLTRLPYGLHMIYLPFLDSIRFPDLPPPVAPSAISEEQLSAARRLVNELALPNDGAHLIGAVPNPASEAHFRALEVAAFTHASASALAPVTDTTMPNGEWLAEDSRAEATSAFFDAFGMTGDSISSSADRPPKRLKASVPTTGAEWMEAYRGETLGDLTADVLKAKCASEGLPKTGKKADLVARLAKHLHNTALKDHVL